MFEKIPGTRVLELGGGDNPLDFSDVRVDIRPGEFTHFTVDFNNQEWPEIGDEGFNVVVSRYCLEHVGYRKVLNFLKQTYRILKSSGSLILVIPNTEAQLRWILEHPNGWDNKDIFNSASELLYGSQDYEENAHCAYFNPLIIRDLCLQAGFSTVEVTAFGDRATDMRVDAYKENKESKSNRNLLNKVEKVEGVEIKTPTNWEVLKQHILPESIRNMEDAKEEIKEVSKLSRKEMFDRHYFTGGSKVGGYAREGLWDYPCHNLTHDYILNKKPESVLELGTGRGYQVKRLQDAGLVANGLEISRHCWLTRVCDGLIEFDICDEIHPWPYKDNTFDLCFSCALLEHIPEECLPWVVSEMKRVSKRGFHGIDFGDNDDGFDKTHVTLKDSNWWMEKLNDLTKSNYHIDITNKEELEKGHLPESLFKGDGKVKLNLGCGLFTLLHNGFVNIDIADCSQIANYYGYGYIRHDLRNGVPINETQSVDMIAMFNLLEELTYEEGLRLLKDIRRVIKPTGVMRISVPDADLLHGWYHNGDRFEYYDELGENISKANTHTKKLYELLMKNNNSTYDFETLQDQLEEAGFNAQLSNFRKDFAGQNLPGQLIRESFEMSYELSLFVNCYPITGS